MNKSRRILNTIAIIGLFVLAQSAFAFQTVPTPESILGFTPGTDYKLANWEQISAYFYAVDKVSDRIVVESIGETEMGNEMLFAVISSEETIANLQKYKDIQQKLADPRLTNDREAAGLIAEGKTVVQMTFSLHGTEVGATQMSPILVYDLLTKNTKEVRDILDNVIITMFPSANPDGVQLIADHYMAQNPGPGVEIKPLPRLYSKYTGHDNNRDWYMLTQKESRLIANQMYKVWFPEIVYDMHQMGNSGARFFLPPFDDPLNPVINPIIVRELQMIGGYFNTELIAGGYPWVENQNRFSMWWHGGMRTAPYYHNMVGILTEAASVNLASPIPARGKVDIHPTINYPVPWLHDREWTIGDIVEQDRIATMALLKCAARNRDMFVANFYKMNKESIEKRVHGAPFAYIMPADQHDPAAMRYFLEIMMLQKTDFFKATDSFEANGKTYEQGSIIAYLNQPSQPHVEAIFGIQKYPESQGQPYDIVGWTLPLQMGVDYDRVESPFTVSAEPYKEAKHFRTGTDASSVRYYAISPRSTDHYRVINGLLAKNHKVELLTERSSKDGIDLPAGTKIVRSSSSLDNDLHSLLKSNTVELYGLSGSVKGKKRQLRKPRIAMVDNPTSMPVGWMRWIMDTNGFEYTLISETDFESGGFSKKFDTILFTSTIPRMRRGQSSVAAPETVKNSISEFMDKSGTVIAWGVNADYVAGLLDLGFEKASPRGRDKFSIPGSILKTNIDQTDPSAYGMRDVAYVFYGRGATNWKSGSGTVVGSYPDSNPLVSGYALGSEYIEGTPTVFRSSFGKGEAVLVGFDPVFRAQPVGTFKLIFNSIYNSSLK